MTATPIEPPEPGCYVEGHWGQYGIARVVQIACAEYEWPNPDAADLADRHLASMGPSTEPDLSADEFDLLVSAADDAEAWLNKHVSAEGYAWGWDDGEFFYGPIETDELEQP